MKNKRKWSFGNLFSKKDRRRANNNKYILITKKWTFLNTLFSLILINSGIIFANYYVIKSSDLIMSSFYPCTICSGSIIAAYLLVLLLFHCSKICSKWIIPETRRSCLSPYTMYKIVDYRDLRDANKPQEKELLPPIKSKNYTTQVPQKAEGTSDATRVV